MLSQDIHLYIASNVHKTDDNSHSYPKSSVIIWYKRDGMDEQILDPAFGGKQVMTLDEASSRETQ